MARRKSQQGMPRASVEHVHDWQPYFSGWRCATCGTKVGGDPKKNSSFVHGNEKVDRAMQRPGMADAVADIERELEEQ